MVPDVGLGLSFVMLGVVVSMADLVASFVVLGRDVLVSGICESLGARIVLLESLPAPSGSVCDATGGVIAPGGVMMPEAVLPNSPIELGVEALRVGLVSPFVIPLAGFLSAFGILGCGTLVSGICDFFGVRMFLDVNRPAPKVSLCVATGGVMAGVESSLPRVSCTYFKSSGDGLKSEMGSGKQKEQRKGPEA